MYESFSIKYLFIIYQNHYRISQLIFSENRSKIKGINY